jgi:putative ABC transport system ATP-binding protein
MGKYLVEVKDLCKYYKDGSTKTVALDDVSFNIEEGESVAIIGPSGSGKTTLLEVMAGLNKPSKGQVLISGKNVHKGNDKETSRFRNQTIGFVFQMMHLQDYFTAVENVMLPLVANGTSRRSLLLGN